VRRVDDRAVHAVVGGDDVAPRRVGLLADGAEVPDRGADGRWDPALVAFEHQVRGLELERGAQLEELEQAFRGERGDAGAAVGLELDQALGRQRSQRRPQAVAGDAVALGQLALDEALPGGQVAVEDPPAQRVRERVDGRDALELGVRGHGERHRRRALSGPGRAPAAAATSGSGRRGRPGRRA
jgi:hypothetical protein